MTTRTITVTLPEHVWLDVADMLEADRNSIFYEHLPKLLEHLDLAISAIDLATEQEGN